MSDIKMKDVWKRPEHFSMFNVSLIGDPHISSNFSHKEAEAIRTAVVNHDRLVEENAELVEMLSKIVEFIPDGLAKTRNDCCHLITKALHEN